MRSAASAEDASGGDGAGGGGAWGAAGAGSGELGRRSLDALGCSSSFCCACSASRLALSMNPMGRSQARRSMRRKVPGHASDGGVLALLPQRHDEQLAAGTVPAADVDDVPPPLVAHPHRRLLPLLDPPRLPCARHAPRDVRLRIERPTDSLQEALRGMVGHRHRHRRQPGSAACAFRKLRSAVRRDRKLWSAVAQRWSSRVPILPRRLRLGVRHPPEPLVEPPRRRIRRIHPQRLRSRLLHRPPQEQAAGARSLRPREHVQRESSDPSTAAKPTTTPSCTATATGETARGGDVSPYASARALRWTWAMAAASASPARRMFTAGLRARRRATRPARRPCGRRAGPRA